ncbi:glycosyltransferase [Microbacterium sp. QXD-8]|uniref:Glycosyltransferase n=1 Tax=Microbacterium psychrotolerans TaxID=3068321 RepID=A0ABU0Z484_9MICO|nr:glycosyltransferase [Microbacterium sp. QXD-8]MDQ7879402.1 glycosyltransferase [Microbacterium sp. QXD-8]
MIPAELPLAHLEAMTDERGLFEHARGSAPRRELGYCLDDVARGLALTAREDGRSDAAAALADRYLRFVEAAIADDGRVRNRRAADGRWTDEPSTGDWWGRALWGLGAAARWSARPSLRGRALRAFDRAAQARSPWLRARCFAAIGAAEVAAAAETDGEPRVSPGSAAAARRMLRDAAAAVAARDPGARGWSWPEQRLRYANAAIPEALIAAAHALGDARCLERGLDLLDFLVATETALDGHLSLTPVTGRGPHDTAPAFDQQPIEAAALAQACLRAFEVTADSRWLRPLRATWAWFEGRNDIGVALFDPETGAGYDGLTPTGRNDNRGAESTLAALSTLQCVGRVAAVAPV